MPCFKQRMLQDSCLPQGQVFPSSWRHRGLRSAGCPKMASGALPPQMPWGRAQPSEEVVELVGLPQVGGSSGGHGRMCCVGPAVPRGWRTWCLPAIATLTRQHAWGQTSLSQLNVKPHKIVDARIFLQHNCGFVSIPLSEEAGNIRSDSQVKAMRCFVWDLDRSSVPRSSMVTPKALSQLLPHDGGTHGLQVPHSVAQPLEWCFSDLNTTAGVGVWADVQRSPNGARVVLQAPDFWGVPASLGFLFHADQVWAGMESSFEMLLCICKGAH